MKFVFNKKMATFMPKNMSDKIDGKDPNRSRPRYWRDSRQARQAYNLYRNECLHNRAEPIAYEPWLVDGGQAKPK